MGKIGFMFFSLCSLFTLTGCWDSASIEDRGFVIGTAIDMEEQTTKEPILSMTNQFVIPRNVPSAPTQGGTDEDPFMNITAEGKSLFQIDQEMFERTDKFLFYEHLKIIIISEKIAQTPHLFSSILDTYIRDPEMRRGIYVVIAEEAKPLLESHPKAQKMPAIFIESLLKASADRAGLLTPKIIGDVNEHLIRKSSYVLPMITPMESRIKYNGGGVFHGYKDQMVGTLTDKEMIGLNFVLTESKGAILEVNSNGKVITGEIKKIRSKVTIDPTDVQQIKATIQIDVRVIIKEILGIENLQSKKALQKIEDTFSDHIEKLVKDIFIKAQDDFNADIFQLNYALQSRHPDVWKKIKDDWEHGANYFSQVDLNLEVETNIPSVGNTIQIEGRNE
ncbi:Ger(x)C family spore germination protein [Virgibacillus sp. W0181]|uniref:Ger(x)C family spore germination protein n=1 Tax=Virgibacillus sp. W0181 TaxID=3391581 RepID=UPI003F4800BE